jgi:hypothetical protein
MADAKTTHDDVAIWQRVCKHTGFKQAAVTAQLAAHNPAQQTAEK